MGKMDWHWTDEDPAGPADGGAWDIRRFLGYNWLACEWLHFLLQRCFGDQLFLAINRGTELTCKLEDPRGVGSAASRKYVACCITQSLLSVNLASLTCTSVN